MKILGYIINEITFIDEELYKDTATTLKDARKKAKRMKIKKGFITRIYKSKNKLAAQETKYKYSL